MASPLSLQYSEVCCTCKIVNPRSPAISIHHIADGREAAPKRLEQVSRVQENASAENDKRRPRGDAVAVCGECFERTMRASQPESEAGGKILRSRAKECAEVGVKEHVNWRCTRLVGWEPIIFDCAEPESCAEIDVITTVVPQLPWQSRHICRNYQPSKLPKPPPCRFALFVSGAGSSVSSKVMLASELGF